MSFWRVNIETNENKSREDTKELVCKECGWNLPRELVDSLIERGDSIYCEKCGIENKKEDFLIPLNPQIIKSVKKENTKVLWDIFTTAKKKSLEYKNRIKTKLDELREKYKEE